MLGSDGGGGRGPAEAAAGSCQAGICSEPVGGEIGAAAGELSGEGPRSPAVCAAVAHIGGCHPCCV